jgi:2-polyprenyl-3-methyl-5-hydroxy-6-metoxy-1,4-benzoquinol methylase
MEPADKQPKEESGADPSAYAAGSSGPSAAGQNAGSDKGAASRESAARGTHDVVLRLLCEHVPAGSVLDLPCGSGAFARRLLREGYAVSAGDIVQHPAVPEGAVFRLADMNAPLPYGDGQFDAVASVEGIEHIERPFDFVRECRRVLKPGAFLFLTTPNISSLRSRWRWFLTGFHHKAKHPLDETHPRPRHHINMLSYAELRYMLHANGLRVEGIHTNRIKPVSWLYAPAVPAQYAVSLLAFRRGIRGSDHARITWEVHREMLKKPALFGESLILEARAV